MADTIDPPEDDDPNPFDPRRLRLSHAFSGGGPDTQRVLTHVPVRKPNRQEFFRTHSNPEMRLIVAVIEQKEDRQIFIVDPELAPALPGETVVRELVTTITWHGQILLWPIGLPDEMGRTNDWAKTAHEAAKRAEEKWVRLIANMPSGCYDVLEAMGQLPDPEWPPFDLGFLLEIAFKERFINDLNHPVLKRLRGEF